MKLPDVCSPASAALKKQIDEALEKYDSYIVTQARRKYPRSITKVEVVDLDIDDLAQSARIDLWLSMLKQEIHNPPAFIRSTVHNEAITIVRKYKPVASLVTDEEGEPYQVQRVIAGDQSTQDPTSEIEYEEMIQSYSSLLAEHVPALPLVQQRAMVCTLKDQIADILPLDDLLRPSGIDVESMHWSETASEYQSERSSLSVARKKMRNISKKKDGTTRIMAKSAISVPGSSNRLGTTQCKKSG